MLHPIVEGIAEAIADARPENQEDYSELDLVAEGILDLFSSYGSAYWMNEPEERVAFLRKAGLAEVEILNIMERNDMGR